MKNKCILWLLLGLAALFAAVSCKSAPPAEEVPPAAPVEETVPPPPPAPEREPGPDQASLDELEAAAARARAARELAGDFDGQRLFPSDWAAAESLFSQAEQGRDVSTLALARDSAARYHGAADAFEAISAQALAASYGDREKELLAARNAALAAGAEALAPDLLLAADNAVLDASEKYRAKDYYGARDSADKSLYMYGALKTGLDAYKIREEIAARGFEAYDSQNVQLADETLRGAAADYSGQDFASAQNKADSALARYSQALRKGWESFASEKGAAASAERQKALDLKANVAVRQEFNSTQAVFVQAVQAFQAQRFDESARLYDDSAASFTVIAQVAQEKKAAAEEALRRANQKMAESDEAARNAEIIMEGGSE